jgi:hypothetical protein
MGANKYMTEVADVRVCKKLILLGIQKEMLVLLRSFSWLNWKIRIQKIV